MFCCLAFVNNIFSLVVFLVSSKIFGFDRSQIRNIPLIKLLISICIHIVKKKQVLRFGLLACDLLALAGTTVLYIHFFAPENRVQCVRGTGCSRVMCSAPVKGKRWVQ